MGFLWHWMAVPAVFVLALGIALAITVVATRPERSQNWRLAAVLIQGSVSTAFVTGLRWLPTTQFEATIILSTFMVVALLGPLVYVEFLATLDSPLVRPFQRPLGRSLLWIFSGGLLVLWAARQDLFIREVVVRTDVNGDTFWENLPGPLFSAVATLAILTYLYGLLVALTAYRRAVTSTARAQAKAYAIAFGIRDAFTALNIALVVLILGENTPRRMQNDLGFPLIDAVFFLLLSYGILRHQLFDIDLKVKFALRQSTVALIFAGAFFVGKETVEALLPGSGVLYGIATALLVGLAFRPIQTLAHRVANVAMPHVQDTPAYRARRQRAIYRAALESAFADGTFTTTERAILKRLEAELAIGAADAKTMEKEVLAAYAGIRRSTGKALVR